MRKARNNIFSVWRVIFQVRTYHGKMYSVVSICFTSEPDLILRMDLSVHKEFNFIKLIHLEIVWIFYAMSDTMLCSFLGHSAFSRASLLFLFSSSSQRLAETCTNRNSLPLGKDREELVCIFCVIHLPGTFPTVGLLTLALRLREERDQLFQ